VEKERKTRDNGYNKKIKGGNKRRERKERKRERG